MSKFYLMAEKMLPDGAILYQRSHDMVPLKTGQPLPESFVGPLECVLDADAPGAGLPTFFSSPALIATRSFLEEFQRLGIPNIETHPVLIRDTLRNRDIEDYVLLNILGRVSCANRAASQCHVLGDGMTVFNTLVLARGLDAPLELALLDEDPDCILISERVYRHLSDKGYPDVCFEPLEIRASGA